MQKINLTLRNGDSPRRPHSQKHITERTSRFLQRLRTHAKNKENVTIDLSNPGWLSISELCVIAAAIRDHANSAESIIKMPEDPYSRQSLALYHLRFPMILGYGSPDQEWQDRVSFPSYVPPSAKARIPDHFANTIPLTWIEAETFGLDPATQDFYPLDPPLDEAYAAALQKRLVKGGFLEPDSVADFIQVIFRELAWNAVLHSQPGNRTGVAVFSAQVFNAGTLLEFALADVGLGIAATLLQPYNAALQMGRTSSFHAQYSCGEQTATLRYAFEPESTSRTAFQTEVDRFSDRGLAIVADSVMGNGTLVLYSDTGAVQIPDQTGKDYRLWDTNTPLQGTLLAGEIAARRDGTAQFHLSLFDELEPDSKRSAYVPAGLVLDQHPARWETLIRRMAAANRENRTQCIIDFGFGETIPRKVEQFIAAIANYAKPSVLIAVNLSATSISSRRIASSVKREEDFDISSIYIISTSDDCKVLHIRRSQSQTDKPIAHARWTKHNISLSTLCAIHYFCNSSFAAYNFRLRRPLHGFYKGTIHLVNGKQTDRYFSLLAHEASGPGARTRWNHTLSILLRELLRKEDTKSAVLLGFSASMRTLMTSLPVVYNSFKKAFCLLSYDVPTREELKRIVSGRDQVVLCTDVLSSASLLREIVKALHAIGANVLGIVSLFETRDDTVARWNTTFEPADVALPLYLGGQFSRRIFTDHVVNPEYWADPVSAVPSKARANIFIDSSKVRRAQNVLTGCGAVEIGHFVQGTRHSSLRVRIERILRDRSAIAAWIDQEKRAVTHLKPWRHFDPRHLFVPAGIDRIEELVNEGLHSLTGPTARDFAEIVCSTYSHEERIELIEVPRTFEPGGQARCAGIDDLTAAHSLRDVIVVDDGVATGSTLRSVLQQLAHRRAKRILVFILLARCTFEELEHWKLTHQISTGAKQRTALVEVRYLLHLPIPFATETDCPQCTALATLKGRYGAAAGLESGLQAIEMDLAAPYIYRCAKDPERFVATWLEYHVLAELATRSPTDFEKLRKKLENLLQDSSNSVEKQAVIRLFLVEWRLLSRARLRQIVRQIVSRVALSQVESAGADERTMIEALSIVRVNSPNDYPFALSRVVNSVAASDAISERVLIHLYGLLPSIQYHEWRDALIQMDSALRSTVADGMPRIVRQREILAQLLMSQEENFARSDPVERFRVALEAISGEEARHIAIGPLAACERVGADKLISKGRDHCASVASQIAAVNRWFAEALYPHFGFLRQPMEHMLKDLSLMNSVHHTYLRPDGEGRYGAQIDIEHFVDALQLFSTGVGSEAGLRRAFRSLSRVIDTLFSAEAPFKVAIRELTSLEPSDVVESTRQALDAYFPNSDIILKWNGLDSREGRSMRVVCPPSYLKSWVSLVRSNIEKYVVQESQENEVKLLIIPALELKRSLRFLSLLVANNGPPCEKHATPSRMSQKFSRALQRYGGSFSPVVSGFEDYPVAARLRLRVIRGIK